MSTIDSPAIVRKLMEHQGNDSNFPDRTGRHTAYQIWQYTSGFGSVCYKLIYGLYANTAMDDQKAATIFLTTANILPNTMPLCLYKHGKLTADGEKWWKSLFGEPPLTLLEERLPGGLEY